MLTGRCLDRGEGAEGGRIVSTPLAPAKRSLFAHAGGEFNFPGSDSDYFLTSLCMCARVYLCICVYIYTCACVCVCVFIHAYINIYIYVLKWISFPSGRKLRGMCVHRRCWAGRKAQCYCNVPARPGMGQAETSSDLSPSCCPFLSLPTNPPAQLPCRR